MKSSPFHPAIGATYVRAWARCRAQEASLEPKGQLKWHRGRERKGVGWAVGLLSCAPKM